MDSSDLSHFGQAEFDHKEFEVSKYILRTRQIYDGYAKFSEIFTFTYVIGVRYVIIFILLSKLSDVYI